MEYNATKCKKMANCTCYLRKILYFCTDKLLMTDGC